MLGFRIAMLRKRMRLSQEQLAKQINVCTSAVGMYEQGRREPSTKILIALAKVFDVSLDYLITGSDTPDRNAERIAGVLLILPDNFSFAPEPLLLNASDLNKVMDVLQYRYLTQPQNDYPLFSTVEL